MTSLALKSVSEPASELQRFCVKFFARPDTAVDDSKFIDVFHRWIQRQILPGILIDVADYRHIANGPGIILIGHEADIVIDRAGGRLGLLYQRKSTQPGTLTARLCAAIETTLSACRLLEQELLLGGDIKFAGDEFIFVANDRLLIPNNQATLDTIRNDLEMVAEALSPPGGWKIQQCSTEDERERFSVRYRNTEPINIETLLENLHRRPY